MIIIEGRSARSGTFADRSTVLGLWVLSLWTVRWVMDLS